MSYVGRDCGEHALTCILPMRLTRLPPRGPRHDPPGLIAIMLMRLWL